MATGEGGDKQFLGGNIYYEKAYNGGYKWTITKRSDVLNYLEYLLQDGHILRTSKKGKVLLIKRFYELCDRKAYKISADSEYFQSWTTFIKQWKPN